MPKFRPNVAALILNKKGKLLICERVNKKGAWQFPQGGIDNAEAPLAAILREIEEEVGFLPTDYEVLEYRRGYEYTYPSQIKRDKKGYEGQTQTYFLCQLFNDKNPDVYYDACEFQDYQWINPKQFELGWLPDFKKEVYQQVMWDFFNVQLEK